METEEKALTEHEAARVKTVVNAVNQAIRITRQLCPEGADRDAAAGHLGIALEHVLNVQRRGVLGAAPRIQPPKKPIAVEPLTYTVP